jgi:HAD superfamily hydrolase (TIGR01509 family)
MNSPIHCVIFDLDGTLVDSEPLCSQAFLDLLPDLDDTVEGLMHRYTGMQMAPVFADIARRLGRPLPEEFGKSYRDHLTALYDAHLLPMPGVAQMLDSLSCSKCVASNGPPQKMAQGLRVTGLSHYFGDNLFSAYDVGHWKPDPQLFLHAASRMAIAPAHCLVVEDSQAGLEAARAAGMRAVHFNSIGAAASATAWAEVSHHRELAELLEGFGSGRGGSHNMAGIA